MESILASGERIPPSVENDPEFIASLERGLRILSAFDAPGLTLAEIAQRTSLSPATARRFLLTLKELGYIGTDGKRFLLRPKVLSLGHAYLRSINADEVFQPHLRALVKETGCNSSAAVLDGSHAVYIATAAMKRLVQFPAAVGVRFAAYATSMGRVLLAHQPPQKLNAYLAAERFEKITEFTETDRDRLRQILGEVRSCGYALVKHELEVGLVAIAVPVRDSAGNVIAAMNCSWVAHTSQKVTAFPQRLDGLRHAAKRVEISLLKFSALAHSVESEYGTMRAKKPDVGAVKGR